MLSTANGAHAQPAETVGRSGSPTLAAETRRVLRRLQARAPRLDLQLSDVPTLLRPHLDVAVPTLPRLGSDVSASITATASGSAVTAGRLGRDVDEASRRVAAASAAASRETAVTLAVARSTVLRALSGRGDASLVLLAPVSYADGQGTRALLAPRSRLVARRGRLTVESPGLLVERRGQRYFAESGRISLGPREHQAFLHKLEAETDAGRASLVDAGMTIDRRGRGEVYAARASLDLTRGRLDLRGARLSLDCRGEARLEAGELRTADAHRALSADRLLVVLHEDAGGGRQTRALANNLRYADPTVAISAGRAEVALRRDPDAALEIGLAARELAVQSREGVLTSSGVTSAALRYRPDGSVAALELAGDKARLRARDGSALEITRGAADVRLREDGRLQSATVRTGAIAWTSKRGDGVSLRGANAALSTRVATDGSAVHRVSGDEISVRVGRTSTLARAVSGELAVSAHGDIERATLQAGALRHHSGGATLALVDSAVTVVRRGTVSTLTSASARGELSGPFGAVRLRDGGSLRVVAEGDRLRSVDAEVGALLVDRGREALALENARVRAVVSRRDGRVESLGVRVGAFGYSKRSGEIEELGVRGRDLDLTLAARPDGGTLATFSGRELDVRMGNGVLDRAGAQKLSLALEANARGDLERARAAADTLILRRGAEHLRLSGTIDATFEDLRLVTLLARGSGEYRDPRGEVDFSGAQLKLAADARGISRTTLQVGKNSGELAGHRWTVRDGLVDFTRDGAVTLRAASFDYEDLARRTNIRGTGIDGALRLGGADGRTITGIELRGETVHAHRDGHTIDIRGGAASLSMEPDLGDWSLTARAQAGRYAGEYGVARLRGDSDFSLRFARGRGLRLDTRITNFDFAAPAPGQGTATLEQLGRNFRVGVTNPDGQPLRLRASTDPEGRMLREVSLDIPSERGRLVVATDDWRVKLGKQSTRVTIDPERNLARLIGRGTNADFFWHGGSVAFASAHADVALDGGRLVLNDLRGARATVKAGGHDIELDIAHIKKQIAKVGRFGGDAEGLSVVLAPAADGSRVVARVSSRFAGVPVALEVRDARALSAGGFVTTNRATFYAVDPTDQGYVTARLGPVQLSGRGGVRATASYSPSEVRRNSSAVGAHTQALHGEHGVTLTRDAIVGRVATPAPSGPGGVRPRVGVSVAVPVDHEAGGIDLGARSAQGAPSVLVNGGVSLRSMSDTRYDVGLAVGAIPGSIGHLVIERGNARLYGVNLPFREAAVPLDAYLGGYFRIETPRSTTTFQAGVSQPVAGLFENRWLNEPSGPGLLGSVRHRVGDIELGVDAGVSRRRDGAPSWSIRGSLTIRF